MLSSKTGGLRYVARVAAKASQAGAGPMGHSVRDFRTVPNLGPNGRQRLTLAGAENFAADLQRARRPALMDIASRVESTKGFTYQQISSDFSKWDDFVSNINAELQKADSPFRAMSGEEALALLINLEAAADACRADLHGTKFAALVLNLPQLAQLSFTAQDKLQIGALARLVVDAAADIMPPNGMGFVSMSGEERNELLQALMDRSLACLSEVGLGLAEADQKALRNIDFSTTVTSLFGGGFTVVGDEQDADAEGSLMLSPGLLLPTSELTEKLEELASASGLSKGDMANQLMVTLISTITHELVHASQYSQISGPDIDKYSEYLRAQTNLFSLAVEKEHISAQPEGKKFVLFHHEQAAWYATQMVRAAVADSPKMDEGMKNAADFMQTELRDFVMLEVLLGITPPAFAVVDNRGVRSPESLGTADDIKPTPRLGRDELNRIAPR